MSSSSAKRSDTLHRLGTAYSPRLQDGSRKSFRLNRHGQMRPCAWVCLFTLFLLMPRKRKPKSSELTTTIGDLRVQKLRPISLVSQLRGHAPT